MVDGTAEQWGEEEVQPGLKAFTTVDGLPSNGLADIVSSKEVANGHGLDNKNADVSDNLEFDDIDGTTTGKSETSSESSSSQAEIGESSKSVGEVVEEEIVELEFEKLKPKLATHSMHCPNCNHEITKVILRRKVLSYRPTEPKPKPEPELEPEPEPEAEAEVERKYLVGCFSCLSLFTCSENGSFNPFDIFGKRPKTNIDHVSPPNDGEKVESKVRENESCFSMFWVIGKDKSNLKLKDPEQPEPVYANQQSIISSDQVPDAGTNTTKTGGKTVLSAGKAKKGIIGGSHVSLDPGSSSTATGDDDTKITIFSERETEQPRRRSWLGYEGVLAEILKSIVYGGLMEVIASLSIVASAAASDTTTLNIIAVALASLIGGVFIIGHNLWDLRDDCYKDNLSQVTNKNKYKELLGQVDYFPLHAFFAILSFLVFGMVPPIAYGFAFRETNDKDFTVVVVAAASLLCVSLLAIFKAYINKCKTFDYFKTLVYYIITTVSVSGVSYVAGNLVTRLMEELGLFDSSWGGGMSLLPHATSLSLASF